MLSFYVLGGQRAVRLMEKKEASCAQVVKEFCATSQTPRNAILAQISNTNVVNSNGGQHQQTYSDIYIKVDGVLSLTNLDCAFTQLWDPWFERDHMLDT